MPRTCLSIVLAAGEGTRMKSAKPKVLHNVAGLEMVRHVTAAATSAGAERLAMVIGHQADEVRAALGVLGESASFHIQEPRLGTAHAVLAAEAAIAEGYDDILVMFADTPLLSDSTLKKARAKLAEGADVVAMAFRTDDPTGYGRMIEKDGRLVAIREHKDASEEERRITLCNGGLMAFAGNIALPLLRRIGNANAKGEFYLTDLVELANADGRTVVALETPFEEVLGVNTRVELAEAERLWQARRRRELMLAGVTMIAPETVFLCHDTQIGPETLIEPNVVFGPKVRVAGGATIRAFSHLEGAAVEGGAEIGPYARLRPGASIGRNAKVGNFCEVKQADVGEGAKINHLSYIGDAVIGAKANIGAGTITCNYDGFNKSLTEIGAGAFIGSNTALVAPVRVGNNAYVASGAVLTKPVPDEALAIARAEQSNKEGYAPRLRARFAAEKARRKAEKQEK